MVKIVRYAQKLVLSGPLIFANITIAFTCLTPFFCYATLDIEILQNLTANLSSLADSASKLQCVYSPIVDLVQEKTFEEYNQGAVTSLAITPDSKYIISLSGKIWDIESDKILKIFGTGFANQFHNVAITPNGEYIVTTSGFGSTYKLINIWDFHTGELINTFVNNKFIIAMIVIDNKHIAISDSAHTIKIYNIHSGRILKTFDSFDSHDKTILSLAVTHDNKKIVSGSIDKTIKIWDIETGELLNTLYGHISSIRSLAITPDDKYFFSGSKDGTINKWDLNTGALIQTRYAHSNMISSLVITPDNKNIISGSTDQTIKIWNLNDLCKKPIIKIAHQGAIFVLAITPDGKKLVSGSSGWLHPCNPWGEIKVWQFKR